MQGKSNMWKNIGKQDSLRDYESSISSSGSRPIKSFHITFEDDKASRTQSQIQKKNKNQQFPQGSNSIIEEEQLDVSPMIITEDRGSKRQKNEQVLEVISFDSSCHGKVTNMNHILSMDEMNEEQFHSSNKIFQQSSSLPNKHKLHDSSHRNKIMKALESIKTFKEQIEMFRVYLVDKFSNWEVEAIKTCKVIKDEVNERMRVSNTEVSPCKPLSRNVQMEQWSKKYIVLQQQILIVNKTLQQQKNKQENLKKENAELQQKLRKIQKNQQQQRNKMGSQQTLLQELKAKNKRLQYQLSQVKLQHQSQLSKMSKLRELIKQKQMSVSSQGEELFAMQKKVKQLKIANQQIANSERKYQIEIKSLKERIERQNQLAQKQMMRSKAQLTKFKNLLKTSEQQLSQCEEYINKLTNQMKDAQADKAKLQEKLKQHQLAYFNKLQELNKYLLQLENHIKQQTQANEYRQQILRSKQAQLFRVKQTFQTRMMELNSKEYELQQVRKEFQQKMMYAQRRQDQMKFEYNNAINAQNAVKDKWYQRYNTMFSPQKHKNINITPQRDSFPLSPRSSLARREVFQVPIRETKSPTRDNFVKVRSERNINTYRSEVPMVSSRNSIQSHKEMLDLGSRINCLRRELTKQLGQIGLKS